MTNTTKTARPAAVNAAFEDVFSGYTDAMNTCMTAQKRMLDQFVGLTERTMAGKAPAVAEVREVASRNLGGTVEMGLSLPMSP